MIRSDLLPCSQTSPVKSGGIITLGVKCIKAFVSCRLSLKSQKKRHFPFDFVPTSEQCSGAEYYVINGQMYSMKYSFLLFGGTLPQE